jgi:hypothetical protein
MCGAGAGSLMCCGVLPAFSLDTLFRQAIMKTEDRRVRSNLERSDMEGEEW